MLRPVQAADGVETPDAESTMMTLRYRLQNHLLKMSALLKIPVPVSEGKCLQLRLHQLCRCLEVLSMRVFVTVNIFSGPTRTPALSPSVKGLS